MPVAFIPFFVHFELRREIDRSTSLVYTKHFSKIEPIPFSSFKCWRYEVKLGCIFKSHISWNQRSYNNFAEFKWLWLFFCYELVVASWLFHFGYSRWCHASKWIRTDNTSGRPKLWITFYSHFCLLLYIMLQSNISVWIQNCWK